MKIINNYNGSKVSVNIVYNESLDNLLKQVPSHMKNLSYKERFIDTIEYIVSCYSYLLPVNVELNNIQFAELIKKYYSLDNERNNYVYDFLMAL